MRRWIYDRPEARVALHTRAEPVPGIVEIARELHPYEIPCVVARSFIARDPAYAQWVRDETAQPMS